jgi:hypothetical protein
MRFLLHIFTNLFRKKMIELDYFVFHGFNKTEAIHRIATINVFHVATLLVYLPCWARLYLINAISSQ